MNLFLVGIDPLTYLYLVDHSLTMYLLYHKPFGLSRGFFICLGMFLRSVPIALSSDPPKRLLFPLDNYIVSHSWKNVNTFLKNFLFYLGGWGRTLVALLSRPNVHDLWRVRFRNFLTCGVYLGGPLISFTSFLCFNYSTS